MRKYNVEVETEETGTMTIATDLKLREAIKTAKSTSNSNGEKIYITWYRDTDGQHGYYNPDGNHAITGEAW
jgi:hypothetical protein